MKNPHAVKHLATMAWAIIKNLADALEPYRNEGQGHIYCALHDLTPVLCFLRAAAKEADIAIEKDDPDAVEALLAIHAETNPDLGEWNTDEALVTLAEVRRIALKGIPEGRRP